MHPLDADNSLLIYLCATVLYGGTTLYCAKKNRVEKTVPLICHLLLLFALEILCLVTFKSYLGLSLFVLVCLLFCMYAPAEVLLPVDQKAVLITGTDSGIGHELAKYLDRLGFIVFAGVLNEKGPGAEELKKTSSDRLTILQLDITNSAQIKEAYLEVAKKLHHADLWGVINNAGILSFFADGELLPMSAYKQCMDVNFFGSVEVSKTFLPLLRKSKGRLVNISSMAGGVPLPRFAPYGASKAALSMFSGSLRQELSKWGVKVSVIHPSGFRTSIFGTADQWKKAEQNLLENLSPDVKKDYGEDYINNLTGAISHMPSSTSPDLSPVLHDVVHALLSKHPHGLYTPGKDSYKHHFIFSYFPLWFYDFYTSGFLGSANMPWALRTAEMKNKKS